VRFFSNMTLLRSRRPLLRRYWAFLQGCGALWQRYGAFGQGCGALLLRCSALLWKYTALSYF